MPARLRSVLSRAALAVVIALAGGRQGAAQGSAVLSWAATAQMVIEEHLAGHLPRAFTRRTLEVVGTELARASEAADPASDPASLETLRREIDTAGRSLDTGDDGGLRTALRAIGEARTRLHRGESTAP